MKSFRKMNCCEPCCDEMCPTSNVMDKCADSHLKSCCPPPCNQCCASSPCYNDHCDPDSFFNCEPQCQPSNAEPCNKQYELMKHVVQCPSSCPPSYCCERPPRRSSFKPKVACNQKCPEMCFETIYMKSYNPT